MAGRKRRTLNIPARRAAVRQAVVKGPGLERLAVAAVYDAPAATDTTPPTIRQFLAAR